MCVIIHAEVCASINGGYSELLHIMYLATLNNVSNLAGRIEWGESIDQKQEFE